MEKLTLHISGMVCENSVKQVRHLLEAMQGVQKVDVDTLARMTVVEHDEQTCAVDDLLETVTLAGLQVEHVELERPNKPVQEGALVRRPVLQGLSAEPVKWAKQNLRPTSA